GIKRLVGEMERSIREVPVALRQAGVTALIIDEIELSGPTLAQLLQLPYFIVSTSVPHNFGWAIPSWLSDCKQPITYSSRLQNALLQVSVFRMRGPVRW